MAFVMKSAILQNATQIMGIEVIATMPPAMTVMQTSFLMTCVIVSVTHYTVILITIIVKLTFLAYFTFEYITSPLINMSPFG